MNEFQQVCSYVSNNLKANFSTLEEATEAYEKHVSRENAKDDSADTLKAFHKKYTDIVSRKYRRSDKRWTIQSWYNFSEIKGILKKNRCYGWQIFDTRNTCGDSMDTIYFKDGVIIDCCYGWGYIEVFGLNPCDYKFLEKVFEQDRACCTEL